MKDVDVSKIIGISIAFSAFVVLTNISLMFNSVGFYQVAKIMTTPVIVLIQTTFYGQRFPPSTQIALIPVIIGAIVATFTDFSFNWIGATFAAAGVIAASLYQIWAGTKQKELDVDSMQLLYHQTPLSAALLLVCLPFIEDCFSPSGVVAILSVRMYSFAFVRDLLLSCLLAVVVNISTYMVIGKTSPVTYNVMGHGKTCFIIIMGFVIFRYPILFKNVFGILLCLCGIFYYTYLKLK